MRNNLIKILAVSAIAVTLGACKGNSKKEPTPVELTIEEIFELDNTGKFKNEGAYITLKQTCVYGNYGNTYVVGVPYEAATYITDFKGFEVELSAQPDWQGETKGRYANVDVTGTLENVNGRPVFKNASLVINAEAKYDEKGNRDENDGAYSAGYWGTSQLKRMYWDGYMDRSMNGVLTEGIYQFASVPEEVTSSGTSFYVAFPGENLDTEDLENESLICVDIPAGLDEATIKAINTVFKGKKAGDFIDMMAITRYDLQKAGMTLLLENWWSKYAKNPKSEDIPPIYNSWTDVATAAGSFYDEFFNLQGANDEDPLNIPFSYLIDSSDFKKNPKEYWVEKYRDELVKVDNVNDCGSIIITANFKTDKANDYYAAVQAALEDQGYVMDETLSADLQGYYLFIKTVADVKVANVLIVAGATQCTIHFTAPRKA